MKCWITRTSQLCSTVICLLPWLGVQWSRHQYFVGHQVLVMVMGGSSSSSWENESSCLSAATAAAAAGHGQFHSHQCFQTSVEFSTIVVSLNMDQTWLVSTFLSLHCTTWAIAANDWSVLGVCFRFNLRSADSGQFLIYTKTKLYGYGFIIYDCFT